jgi:3-dehydroquinate synthase
MRNFYKEHCTVSDSVQAEDDIDRILQTMSFSTCLTIVDENVADTFVSLSSLTGTRKNLYISAVRFSEEEKSVKNIMKFVERYQTQLDRRSLIIAIGGGTLIDFVGFFAGIMYRGIPYLSVPTSLMSMADSAYGGKSAVNLFSKNQLGLYHYPTNVYVNTNFLKSLPTPHFLSGLVEIFKLSFFDRNIKLTIDCLNIEEAQKNPTQMEELVLKAATLKLRFLEHDPYEETGAALFLYGHPFANAFEAYSWETLLEYLPHGYAVGLGMLFSAWLAGTKNAAFSGLMNEHFTVLVRVHNFADLVEKYTPPTREIFMDYLSKDKYCCQGIVAVPALFLNNGYSQLPLANVAQQYTRWRIHIMANAKVTGEMRTCNE